MHSQTVLVTGAFGFLGAAVSQKFKQKGFKVLEMGHGGSPSSDVTLENLKKLGSVPAVIVHCAGSASVAESLRNPLGDFQKNVNSFVDVLEYVRTTGGKTRVVFPSSTAVYGQVAQQPIAENAPYAPVSVYGNNKKICEELGQFYATFYKIPVTVIRFFSVYGPGLKKQLLWDACNKLKRGETLFGGTGEETRDWLYVEDAAELCFLSATRPASEPWQILNGASGTETSIKKALTKLFQIYGYAGAPKFSGESRAGDPTRYWADISRAQAWGWSPQHSLDDGLAAYVKWFKECNA